MCSDLTAGFRAYRSDIIAKIDIDTVGAEGYGFQIEMTYRVAQAGGRIVEVPIKFVDRVRGTSKMSSSIIIEAMGLGDVVGDPGPCDGRRRPRTVPPEPLAIARRSRR